jgi:hypothetical protein
MTGVPASAPVPETAPFWDGTLGATMMSPGGVAPEASVIRVPVPVAVGERDVCPRP